MKLTLKQWRGVRELSQKEMSERLGVHINAYQKMEKKPESIKVRNALRIAEIFNVPIDDISFATEGEE